MTLLAALCITAAFLRRQTIHVRWEASATAGLILIAGGILLSTTDVLDQALQDVFGVAHLDDFIGNLCYLVAGLCFTVHTLERLAPAPQRAQIIKAWFEGPLTIVVALMFACLVLGGGCPDRLLLTDMGDGMFDWLDAYASVWYAGMSYLAIFNGTLMWQLRTEQRNCVLCMYIGQSAASVIACTLRAGAAIFDSPTLDTAAYTAGAAGIILLCTAASWSWRQKMAPYRRLLHGTRTHPTVYDVTRRWRRATLTASSAAERQGPLQPS